MIKKNDINKMIIEYIVKKSSSNFNFYNYDLEKNLNIILKEINIKKYKYKRKFIKKIIFYKYLKKEKEIQDVRLGDYKLRKVKYPTGYLLSEIDLF